jgi:tetratricopeptide (TPR) repeat protein
MRIVLFLCLVACLYFLACSPESTSWAGRVFNNTTAHYNGYFYAKDGIARIEKTIRQNHQDDYNQILWLFPRLDSVKAKSYDKEIQEVIKMASIAIQRHPKSKWVDDSYLVVGKARLYSFDWGNAIQTFKYVNNPKVTSDKNMRHLALIWLLRTYIEHREFNNAETVIDYLKKEQLNRTNRKFFLLHAAYYHQVRGDLNGLIQYLSEAAPLLNKRDKPGRIYFIMGQVYQSLGFEFEAYNFYQKCLATHPVYETDFYARLYMAQVAEISRSRDLTQARKSFKKLLTDAKNRDFKDKIYYELGLFEEKQGNLKEAITNYNLALRSGNNPLVKGDAYLRLGHVYFDSLRKFSLAKDYYDSAVRTLPPGRKDYPEIKKRQETLNEFIKHYTTIRWNDSLLYLATLDTISLRKLVENSTNQNQADAPVEKRSRSRSTVNNTVMQKPDAQSDPFASTGSWYFSSVSTVANGRTEFNRIWGSIPLEDNWRTRSRSTSATSVVRANSAIVETPSVAKNNLPVDRSDEALQKLMEQIPYTAEQKKKALREIEESLFALGDIYYYKLHETQNAIEVFEQLLTRFPGSVYEPEVLYKLYLILKEINPERSTAYLHKLDEEHPESVFTRLAHNPNYMAETAAAEERQKQLYKKAYEYFLQNEFLEAGRFIREAKKLEETAFTPHLELLEIMIEGKNGDTEKYVNLLKEFMEQHKGTDLHDFAKNLLEAARLMANGKSDKSANLYTRLIEEPHYFILAFSPREHVGASAMTFLQAFNANHFRELHLKVSRTELNDAFSMILVSDLPRLSTAIEYYRLASEKLNAQTDLRNFKFYTFVISKGNFNTLYRTHRLNEYLEFFAQVYRTDSP